MYQPLGASYKGAHYETFRNCKMLEISENSDLFYFLGFSFFIVICVIVILIKLRDRKLLKTVTQINRGTKSERRLVLSLLKSGVPAQTIFHDLYLKKKNGEYSQIDLVVATKVGIIVFEVKDYSGWIFGSEDNWNWTQVLAYGKKKYSLYNPIMQNNKHIEVLKKKTEQLMNIPFYSVVVFYGDCTFKKVNFTKKNELYFVKSKRILRTYRKILKNNQPAKYYDKHEIVKVLTDGVINGNDKQIRNQHVEDIRKRFGRK
jgi:hypothetical protein